MNDITKSDCDWYAKKIEIPKDKYKHLIKLNTWDNKVNWNMVHLMITEYKRGIRY